MTRRSLIVMSVIAALLLGACGASSDKEPEETGMGTSQAIADTLIAMEEAALDRWGNGDPDGFLEIIAEDYTYFDPFIDLRVDNHDGIKNMYDPLRGTVQIDRFELIDPKVQVSGDIAVLTFNFKSYGTSEDGSEVEQSHWHTTEAFRRIDGTWKLISTHWSFARPQLVEFQQQGTSLGEPASVAEAAFTDDDTVIARAVLDAEQSALDRWGKGDVTGYLEIMADDYTYFDPSLGKRIDGLAAIREYLEPLQGTFHIDRFEFVRPRVQTDGTTAVLTFNLQNFDAVNDGEDMPSTRWHSTEIYRKLDGQWRLISSHWSFAATTLSELLAAGRFSMGN